MKIVSSVLENIEGIQIFYNIGVLIFLAFLRQLFIEHIL